MDIGKLDRQITIERKVVTADPEYGTELVTWAPLVLVPVPRKVINWYDYFFAPFHPPVAQRIWAEVQDALPSKAESVVQGLAVARNQVRIRFRWRADVDSSMRVVDDTNVTMQIVGGPASVGGRKVLTEIVCERYSS